MSQTPPFKNLSEEDLKDLSRPPEWLSSETLAAIAERVSEEEIRVRPPDPDNEAVAAFVGMLEFPMTLAELRIAYCREVNRRLNGNKSATARELGISRRQVIRILTGR